jgi:hypothetical protein
MRTTNTGSRISYPTSMTTETTPIPTSQSLFSLKSEYHIDPPPLSGKTRTPSAK